MAEAPKSVRPSGRGRSQRRPARVPDSSPIAAIAFVQRLVGPLESKAGQCQAKWPVECRGRRQLHWALHVLIHTEYSNSYSVYIRIGVAVRLFRGDIHGASVPKSRAFANGASKRVRFEKKIVVSNSKIVLKKFKIK
jgi:hypothetical protein